MEYVGGRGVVVGASSRFRVPTEPELGAGRTEPHQLHTALSRYCFAMRSPSSLRTGANGIHWPDGRALTTDLFDRLSTLDAPLLPHRNVLPDPLHDLGGR
ncbi:MAG: hypothetical protein RL417_1147 [Pseudomonadota bacterium]